VVTRQLQVERRTGKFAGQRPTFYHCATQVATNQDLFFVGKCIIATNV